MEIDYRIIRESFVQTSLDMLQRCESDLIAAESSAVWPDLTEFLRSVHTIKGNAGIFELAGVIAICHAMETALDTCHAGSAMPSAEIDKHLTAIDLLRRLIADGEKTDETVAAKVAKTVASLGGATTAETSKPQAAPAADFAPEIKLPKKYYDYAEKENKRLHLVILNLGAQKDLKLSALHAALATLNKRKELLSFGDLTSRLQKKYPDLTPYYLVVTLAGSAEEYFSAAGIEILYARCLTVAAESAEAAVAPESTVAVVTERQADTHLKVRADLLTALIDLTGEIVLARNTLLRRISPVRERSLESAGKKVGQLVSDLQDLVMRTRLQPIRSLLQRLPRLVRETALATGKKAELRIDDGGIEIDKVIFDQIDESLTHLMRNAVDHGIETPDERLKRGKNAAGMIDLKVTMQAGSILIHIRDDGRGLHFETIREKALQKKLISEEQALTLDKAATAKLIFLPGFSTRDTVNEISGRGVGMDVVRTSVTRAGGTVDINYDAAAGTEFILRIPQTLSILTCLIIEAGDRRLAVPRQNVAEIIQFDETKLRRTPSSTLVVLRDELIPVIDTNTLLGIAPSDTSHYLILKTERHRFALTAGRILDTEEVVVKPVPVKQKRDLTFSGAAVMGDGQIALILDLHAIAADRLKETEQHLPQLALPLAAKTTETNVKSSHLLVEVVNRRVLLNTAAKPRIEKISAKNIEINDDSASIIYDNAVVPVIPWEKISGHTLVELLDTKNADLHAVIYDIAGYRFALVVTQLMDIVTSLSAPVTARLGDGLVTGETVIAGASALILDPQRIASHNNKSGEYYAKAG